MTSHPTDTAAWALMAQLTTVTRLTPRCVGAVDVLAPHLPKYTFLQVPPSSCSLLANHTVCWRKELLCVFTGARMVA